MKQLVLTALLGAFLMATGCDNNNGYNGNDDRAVPAMPRKERTEDGRNTGSYPHSSCGCSSCCPSCGCR